MAKILTIDDSESFRIQVRELLKNHEVFEAEDGIDGLKQLETINDIELILCDLNMPNMDGFTFCKKKSEIKEFEKIPIIMITTESNTEIKKELKSFGVKGWILKPFDSKSFIFGVQFLLDQQKIKG